MLDEVRKALRPDDSLAAVRDDIIEKINAEIARHDVKAHASAGGSTAKDTYLPGDHDIDVFVRFSLEYANVEEQLSDILEKILAPFKPDRIHGSRDYFQFTRDEFEFEIIPVLAVEDYTQARNVTDMSPIHVEYFASKTDGHEDEVRLAKQFCKACGVYGAESYIRGFSGHVIDLLILAYGSFYDLMKEATKWKAPVIIDLEEHHENALSAIDTEKHAPLILVDPVQPQRNAAAALSKEQFDAFVDAAKSFLRSPSEEFFVVQEFSETKLRTRLAQHAGAETFIVVTHLNEDKKDVAGARIRKVFERLQDAFAQHEFTVVEQGWHFRYGGESLLWFVCREHSLPRLMKHMGPPVSQFEDAQRFREAHPDCKEEDGRLVAQIERPCQRPIDVPLKMQAELEERGKVSIRVEVAVQ